MNDLFSYIAAADKAARETETGKLLLAAGYTVEHTGGGCMTWELPATADNNRLVWITVDEFEKQSGSDLVVPEPEIASWIVGIYPLTDGFMTDVAHYDTVKGLSIAIERAAELRAKPDLFERGLR